MASLSDEDRAKAIAILEELRRQIAAVAGEDRERLFQMRRYILKRLEFDERGTPTQRRKLKDAKRKMSAWTVRLCHGDCRNVVRSLIGFKRSMGILQEIRSWFAIAVIRRLKKSAELVR